MSLLQMVGTKISQVTEIRRLFNYTPINVNEFFAWSNSAEGRRKQRDVILKLLTDTDRKAFNDLDLLETGYYNERTEVNKKVETAESTIKSIVLNKEDEALIPREKEARDLITLYRNIIDLRKSNKPIQEKINDLKLRKERLEFDLKYINEEIGKGEEAIKEGNKAVEKYNNLTDEDLALKLEKGNEIITKITSLSTKTDLKKEWQ
ncbi:MAG: hypothetical protein UR43_C0019G0001, partial [candidate division TM6 bacterium GW2011_GWF2_33_332]